MRARHIGCAAASAALLLASCGGSSGKSSSSGSSSNSNSSSTSAPSSSSSSAKSPTEIAACLQKAGFTVKQNPSGFTIPHVPASTQPAGKAGYLFVGDTAADEGYEVVIFDTPQHAQNFAAQFWAPHHFAYQLVGTSVAGAFTPTIAARQADRPKIVNCLH